MKFYYYYGVMGSSKTANALMKKFNFEERGKKVVLLKSVLDTRSKENLVESRVGLSCEATLVYPDSNIKDILKNMDFDIIIADEAQFFTSSQIDELRLYADSGIIVMCYGLKTDFTGHLFEGSKRLLEVCDTIREIQCMCSRCNNKAIINGRHQEDKIIYNGNIIDIGGEEKYIALCHDCWIKGKI